MEYSEVTLLEYWRVIRKRQGTFFFVFFMVLMSTFFFTKMQTPIYQATLELRIEKSQPLSLLDSTGSDAQSFLTITSWENLATEVRLIKSLPVLKRVVEKMEVLPSDPEEREKRIHALSVSYQSRIDAQQIEGTNIIKINVVSDDPQDAVLLATAIADVYIVENIESRKRRARALVGYIDEQLAKHKDEIAEEENKMQNFNQKEKVFEVVPEVKDALDRLTIAGTFAFESQLLVIQEGLKEVKRVLSKMEPGSLSGALKEEPWAKDFIFVGLRRRMLEMEFERFLLLIDYTENHPLVLAKGKDIAEVKNKIAIMIKNASGVKFTEKTEEQLAYVIKKLFAESESEVLYRIINGFYGDTGSLSSNQLKFVRLERNIKRLIEAHDKLLKQKQEVELNLAKVIDDVVTVVSPAVAPKIPIKPNAMNNYMVSIVIGLLLGVLFCFVRESLDSSIATIADVEHELKLSMLGIIPHMSREEVLRGESLKETTEMGRKLELQKKRLVVITNPKSWPAESIKMLRTNLMQVMKTNNYKSILVTSSDRQEGKSTIVANVGLSLAHLGKKTILVGCNMRRPTIYKIFGLTRGPGLSDILMGNITWQEATRKAADILTGGLNVDDLLRMPGIDNLNIIPCGRSVDNVSEILNSKAFDNLLAELKQNYDVVIIDCSPVMAVPDAVTLCDKVDGIVLVYKVGHTPKDILGRCKENLMKANANILGVVLNDIRTEAQVGYSAYYYRYYDESSDEKKGLFGGWGKMPDRSKTKSVG